MNNLIIGVLNIDAEKVLEDADVESFPMLVKNMRSWSLILENQSTQIDQSNLGLFFSHLNHLHELIYGFQRDVLQAEGLHPLFEVLY